MSSLRRWWGLAVLLALLTTAGPAFASGGPASDRGADKPSRPPPTTSLGLDPLLGDQKRPNLVVIMADDLRNDELKYMPRTRSLLGGKGVRFVNTFSPLPMCCPARASFLTGQYPHNHGVWGNRPPYGFPALDDSRTVAVSLNRVGYNTIFLGKYLNGYGMLPRRGGAPSARYVPPGWTEWRASVDGASQVPPEYAGGTYRYYDMTLNVNGTLESNQGRYSTQMLGAESQDVIAQYARSPRPFFLWAAYVAPHVGFPHEPDDPDPIARADGYTNRFWSPARPPGVRGMFDAVIANPPGAAGERDISDKPFFMRRRPQASAAELAALREVARQRAESLWVLDQQVARTVEALDRAGELDNTLIMFTSDQGYFLGEHRILQGKLLPYDPSIRVPLLVRGPGVPAGQRRRDPFVMTDFAPTLLAAAGAPTDPRMDGINMLPVARRGDRGWSRGILTETGPRYPGSSIVPDPLNRRYGPSLLRFTQGIRTSRYLYVEHASRERELYDLRRDPGQLNSIVDQPQARPLVGMLSAALNRLRDCAGASCSRPLPPALRGR